MAISSGVPVTERIKGFFVGVSVPRWRWPTISLIIPKYSERVSGEYPRVLRVDTGSEADVGFDSSPLGALLGIVLPGVKKVYWWIESSWLKPSRREVRIVTAP